MAERTDEECSEAVRQYTALYNTKSKEFKDKYVRIN